MKPFLSGELPGENFGQIGREIGYFQSFYQTVPKVFIGYDRLAFAGIDDPQLRITFDTNLRWRDTDVDLRLGDHGAPIARSPRRFPNTVPATVTSCPQASTRPI